MNEKYRWLKHIKELATDNADLRVTVRKLKKQVSALHDEVEHYSREFARQNAEILTLAIQLEVEKCQNVSDMTPIFGTKCQNVKVHDSMEAIRECGSDHDGG